MRTEPAGDRAIAGLSPSNFAIVMATGIVGLAAHQQAHATIAAVLLVLTGLAWVAIAALTAARLVLHPGRMLADLRSHQRAPGFLTAVAATAVLGSQLLVQEAWPAAAGWLAAVAAVLWIGLTYCILLSLIIARDKPLLPAGISGSWLLTVVSTQSLAVLGALLAAHAAQPLRLYLNFAAMACWLCGGMVYVWVISLIFYRYAFFPFAAKDLAPTYWINMGAMAISALAGALLVLGAPGAPFLLELLPVVKVGTLLYWAVGTWWIPLLAGLAAWRYLHQRHPLAYDVGYWGAVFPLGMFSAASHQVALALGVTFLEPVARGFFYLAVAAWLLAALGLARHLGRVLGMSQNLAGRNRA